MLVSGNLGYITLVQVFESDYRLTAVFTDNKSQEIIQFCQQNKIAFFVGNPRNGKASDFLKSVKSEVLLSVNYLFIIDSDIINLPSKYAINFHGSLLPKYRGRTPHVWAIINGEKHTGITAHLIDEEVDNGDIVHQISFDISEEMTGGEILEQFQTLYPQMIKAVLFSIMSGSIKLRKQDKSKATYFGKRTPDSGRIDWMWCRERIRNWIRAQARPYPGAFTYYENKRITIHKALFSNLGFSEDIENGSVLDLLEKSVFIKTPNGVLEILEIEGLEIEKLKKGDILR